MAYKKIIKPIVFAQILLITLGASTNAQRLPEVDNSQEVPALLPDAIQPEVIPRFYSDIGVINNAPRSLEDPGPVIEAIETPNTFTLNSEAGEEEEEETPNVTQTEIESANEIGSNGLFTDITNVQPIAEYIQSRLVAQNIPQIPVSRFDGIQRMTLNQNVPRVGIPDSRINDGIRRIPLAQNIPQIGVPGGRVDNGLQRVPLTQDIPQENGQRARPAQSILDRFRSSELGNRGRFVVYFGQTFLKALSTLISGTQAALTEYAGVSLGAQ